MIDQKIKAARGKCPLDLIPLSSLKGPARVYGYGARKYAPGNYHTADDDQIAQRYMGGVFRHASNMQNPNGLYDMKSISALDKESGLPEIDHMICGLLMLRALAVKHGALPADPGVGNDPKAVPKSAEPDCMICAKPCSKVGHEACAKTPLPRGMGLIDRIAQCTDPFQIGTRVHHAHGRFGVIKARDASCVEGVKYLVQWDESGMSWLYGDNLSVVIVSGKPLAAALAAIKEDPSSSASPGLEPKKGR